MIDTHNLIIRFGKYKGELWTRLPQPYLRTIAEKGHGNAKIIAQAEIIRRGLIAKPEVELSPHAINRASQITSKWKKEGVYAWLQRITNEAAQMIFESEVVIHDGYKFAFLLGKGFPILKTIMKDEPNVKPTPLPKKTYRLGDRLPENWEEIGPTYSSSSDSGREKRNNRIINKRNRTPRRSGATTE